jgi:hypothetical protein
MLVMLYEVQELFGIKSNVKMIETSTSKICGYFLLIFESCVTAEAVVFIP